jgi:hypothetical protein
MATQPKPPSAAAALYPHLARSAPEPKPRPQSSLASAMFPSLVKPPPPPPNINRDALLRALRAHNAE